MSQRYPHRKEAGMEQKMAIEVITPKASSGPPKRLVFLKTTTYSGMKTVSKPNAISWKKNPNRHIAKNPLQRRIKAFACKKRVTLETGKNPSFNIEFRGAGAGKLNRSQINA